MLETIALADKHMLRCKEGFARSLQKWSRLSTNTRLDVWMFPTVCYVGAKTIARIDNYSKHVMMFRTVSYYLSFRA